MNMKLTSLEPLVHHQRFLLGFCSLCCVTLACYLGDTFDKASATWTNWQQHITQPEQSSEQASVMQHKVQKPNDNIWQQTLWNNLV